MANKKIVIICAFLAVFAGLKRRPLFRLFSKYFEKQEYYICGNGICELGENIENCLRDCSDDSEEEEKIEEKQDEFSGMESKGEYKDKSESDDSKYDGEEYEEYNESTSTSSDNSDILSIPAPQSTPLPVSPINHFGIDGSNYRTIETVQTIGDKESGINGLVWKDIEPREPLNGKHYYNWSATDKFYNKIASTGREFQINISPTSEWAVERDPNMVIRDAEAGGKTRNADKKIKDEHKEDWQNFLKEFIKRYPSKNIQIGSEAENIWSNAEGYIEAALLAKSALTEIDPNIKIMAAGFNVGDFFALSKAEQSELLKDSRFAHKIDFIEDFLAKGKDCFDILSLHLNRDYTAILPTIDWFTKEMSKNDYQKPIWSDDMASGPFLDEKDARVSKLGSGDPETVAWFQKEQSKLLVKKITTAFINGVDRVFLSSDTDWTQYYEPEWRYMGLMDTRNNFIKKPSFYTYKSLVKNINYFSAIQEIYARDGIYIYKFVVDNKSVFVLWSESGEKNIDLSNFISSKSIKINYITTGLDSSNDPVIIPDKISSSDNIIINEYPIFVNEN